jgi:hypothetical protein
VLVTQSSGCLDLRESVQKQGRFCDHLEINKFKSKNDEDFILLGYSLSKMAKMGRTLVADRAASMYDSSLIVTTIVPKRRILCLVANPHWLRSHTHTDLLTST